MKIDEMRNIKNIFSGIKNKIKRLVKVLPISTFVFLLVLPASTKGEILLSALELKVYLFITKLNKNTVCLSKNPSSQFVCLQSSG